MVTGGCRNAKKNAARAIQADAITLPETGELAAAEKQRIMTFSDAWFNTYLQNSAFNGGVIVAKNGAIAYERYKGTDDKTGAGIDTNSVFHIASVTKTFTAMLVLKLWEDGKLNIDAPFKKYFPAFNYDEITVKDLLTHRSGLPNYLYFMEKLWIDKTRFIKNEDILTYLINYKGILKDIGTPNSRFSYSNTNYALLALLIEKVTGNSYAAFVDSALLKPLKMRHSFVYTQKDSARISKSFDYRGGEIPFNYLDAVYGDKNIYSTPRDLLIWDRYLNSGLFLKPETLAAAYMPYSNERPGIKNYGLGWRMNIYDNGKKMIFHNGWWHGNNAVFIRLMDENATIIVLNNKYTSATYKARLLANIFYPYYLDNASEDGEPVDANAIPVDTAVTNNAIQKRNTKVQ